MPDARSKRFFLWLLAFVVSTCLTCPCCRKADSKAKEKLFAPGAVKFPVVGKRE